MSTTHGASPSQKFRIEKLTNGGITFLAMHGVLDESFEGQKVAETIRTKKVIVSLREVRRFASWGMAEWMNFLRGTVKLDVYLVECSTYAVNQMNLVTGLLGHGKLVSFYSPYRCGSCGEEFETLMLVPSDRAAIRELADSEKVCATCGGRARMDKYPASMCTAISERAVFDMEDEVVNFLRNRLKYDLTPDITRFRAHRRVAKGNTYLRVTGNLASLPVELLTKASEGTTVVDLAKVMFDPNDLAQWRSYVRAASATASGTGSSLQLLDCPPGFFEHGVRAEDLQSNLKVRTFALTYLCPTCNTTSNAMIDVAQNLEQLIEGAVPAAACPTCHQPLVPVSNDAVMLMRRLPAREHDAALDAFVTKARREPDAKLEDCLASRVVKPPRGPGVPRGVYVASALTAVVVGGLAVALVLWRQHREPVVAAPAPVTPSAAAGAAPATPAFARPEWIISEVPSSAFCQDMINRLVCVGVSSYRKDRNEAVADATAGALDELVNTVGLKISDGFFRESVLPGYSDARGKALAALQSADTDRTSAAYAAADDVVRKARKRVAEILQTSGGAAVPAQRSDWHWEEYAVEKGSGTEFLVFVRYDVTLDAAKSLVEKYSAATPIAGGTAMTAFPGLAWQYPDFTGGAMLVKLGPPLASAKLASAQIVMAAGDQRVADATALAHRFDELHPGTSLKLTVKSASAAPQVVEVRR